MERRPIKIRRSWDRKPQTQVKQSDKLYDRRKERLELKKEIKGV
jgi:hypothetical protein